MRSFVLICAFFAATFLGCSKTVTPPPTNNLADEPNSGFVTIIRTGPTKTLLPGEKPYIEVSCKNKYGTDVVVKVETTTAMDAQKIAELLANGLNEKGLRIKRNGPSVVIYSIRSIGLDTNDDGIITEKGFNF